MSDFDKEFDRFERRAARIAKTGVIFAVAWMLFIIGAVSVGLYILGAWAGVW